MPDLLAQRLNFDAAVFLSCSMKEMQVMVLISLVTCILILGILTQLVLNMFLIGVGLAFPATVALTWFMALTLQKMKQGKPKGYLKQQFLLKCEDVGLISSIYIRRSGKWSIGK